MSSQNDKLKQTNIFEHMITSNITKYTIKRTTDFLVPCPCNLDPRVTDIQFECEGYSIFDPERVLENFMTYFGNLVEYCKKNKMIVYTIKITINGFRVRDNFVRGLVKNVMAFQETLKVLWINTNDLENVCLGDFADLFKLMSSLGKSKNFDDYSLQCANWTFKGHQPNFREIQKTLKSALQDSFNAEGERVNVGMSELYQKRIRLEISGWWSHIAEAKLFLDFAPNQDQLKQKKLLQYSSSKSFTKQQFNKEVQRFHSSMFLMISKMLQIMQQIECMEIDMRNNHEILELKKLKQKIISGAIKTQRTEMSIISMRQGHQNTGGGRDEEKEKSFRLNIAM